MTLDPLITTEDLVAELKRRYPLLIVAGSADMSKDCSAEILFYHGPHMALLGLTDIIHYDLLDQYHGGLEPCEDVP